MAPPFPASMTRPNPLYVDRRTDFRISDRPKAHRAAKLSHYDRSGSLVILARPHPVGVAGTLVPVVPEVGWAKASRIRGGSRSGVKILGIYSPVFRPGSASDCGLMIHHIR